MAEVNIPAVGGIEPPPPGAPIETAQPVRPDAGSIVVFDRETRQPTGEVLTPDALAARNERALAPLTYGKVAAESPVAGKPVGGVDPFYTELAKRKAARALTVTDDPVGPDPTMPAASNSDTPSRGIPGTAPVPAARSKPPLQTEGGFGMGGGAQYYPLDGSELKELVCELLDRLHARVLNDLRFTMAICYPRVAVKLQLIVEAEAEVGGTGFELEFLQAHEKTALEVAKQHADSVVFVLREQKREFNESGQVETPPDAMRVELGLEVPRKQLVQMGHGKTFADRPLGY